MLLTDSVFVTVADLQRLDSEVETVATAEQITLSGENGLLRGSIEEFSTDLQKIIVSFGNYIGTGEASANHMQAVLNVGANSRVRQKCSLSQVVVSGDAVGQWNHIKEWAVYRALQSFYADAFNRTVRDRYEGKMQFYKNAILRGKANNAFSLGLPLVLRPLACPAALFERDSGVWDEDNVGNVSGSGGTQTYIADVAITYVDMSNTTRYVDPDTKNNSESGPAQILQKTLAFGGLLQFDITSLNPPSGRQHPSQLVLCPTSPLTATHWNVYVGMTTKAMYLQNSVPIPIATKTYTLAADPVLSGARLDKLGQYAEMRLVLSRKRQRG